MCHLIIRWTVWLCHLRFNCVAHRTGKDMAIIQSSGGRGWDKGSYAYNGFLVIIFFQVASEICAFEGNKGDVILRVSLGQLPLEVWCISLFYLKT